MSTENLIYSAAISDGMPPVLAALIVAQSKHESANYTSAVFNDCRNAFGYSVCCGNPVCNGHSFYQSFNSLTDSVHSITGWIKRRVNEGKFPALNTITTPLQYATLLRNAGYYTDPLSVCAGGLNYYFDPNISPDGSGQGSGANLAIWAALAVGVYLIAKN